MHALTSVRVSQCSERSGFSRVGGRWRGGRSFHMNVLYFFYYYSVPPASIYRKSENISFAICEEGVRVGRVACRLVCDQ